MLGRLLARRFIVTEGIIDEDFACFLIIVFETRLSVNEGEAVGIGTHGARIVSILVTQPCFIITQQGRGEFGNVHLFLCHVGLERVDGTLVETLGMSLFLVNDSLRELKEIQVKLPVIPGFFALKVIGHLVNRHFLKIHRVDFGQHFPHFLLQTVHLILDGPGPDNESRLTRLLVNHFPNVAVCDKNLRLEILDLAFVGYSETDKVCSVILPVTVVEH